VNWYRLKRIIITTIAVCAVLAAAWFIRMKTRNAVDTLVANKNMIHVLIAGHNNFSGNKVPFYSIVSINPENGRVGITFLPPSLRVEVSDDEFVRLDKMDVRDYDRTCDYLNKTLRIKIRFYMIVYAPDVSRFVDMIEGVNLYVLEQVKDIDGVSTGINYFDGRKIVKYINYTDDNSIYRKYDRIQDILYTLYYNRDAYKGYIDKDFISETMKTVKTNIMPNEAYSLAKLIMMNGDLYSTILPGKMTDKGDYSVDEIACKTYESEFKKRLIVTKNDADQVIKVKVLNATGIPGVARKMRTMLVREGVSVIEFGTYPGPALDHSIIINQKGDIASVKKISDLTGITRIHHIFDSSQLHSVLVIAGKDMAE
jgi:hypothetical protein